SCFIKAPNGEEWWHVFHAKRDSQPGWRRAISIQPFKFDHRNGRPHLRKPVAAGEPMPRPAGELLTNLQLPHHSDLSSGYSYFGHHQFYTVSADGLTLGSKPTSPVNAYRSGEKIVLDGLVPNDFTASISIDFGGNAEGRGAGILFRTSAPSVGYDAHRGYFIALKPSEDAILLGKMDGHRWLELKRVHQVIDPAEKQHLSVTAVGDRFEVKLDGRTVLTHRDATYKTGTVGLRAVDIPATFSKLSITSP
ncbi:MAG: family 16 glycoside hydrolase, partial [Verrucomicrobiales bacterium]